MTFATQDIVYLNGEFIPLDQAKVSVMDRGFLFGDGVYEVIPVFGRKPFRGKQHIQRLENSLKAIAIKNPLSYEEWLQIFYYLIAQYPAQDQSLYLQITRGVSNKRQHIFTDEFSPTILVKTGPIVPPHASAYTKGISAITYEDIRWQYCDIKSIALLANVLLRQKAYQQQATEAILIHQNKVLEGAASSVFVVLDDVLYTAANSQRVLPGTTRDLVLELAQAHDMKFKEQAVTPEQLKQAQEIWTSSSTQEILPVTTLDHHPVGNGKPGSYWRQMLAFYQAYKKNFRQQSVTQQTR